jgi:putative ABC transport system permease protein
MTRVALQMLFGDKMKFFALIIGLTFSAMMIAQQASIFTGYAGRSGAWIRDTSQGDLWVIDPQMEVFIDQKRMTNTQLQRVRSVDGVAWATQVFSGFLNARLPDGTIQAVRVVGLDDATLMGGPPRMVHGTLADLRRDRGIIVNSNDLGNLLKPRRKPGSPELGVGDRLDINDNEVEIVGVYSKSAEFFWEPVVYTTFSRALTLAPPERKLTQFIMVKAQPGQDLAQLQSRINAATGLAAHTGAEFARLTTRYILIQTGILINFGITIALGFVIGVLVSGLLLYSFVLENTKNFAALKAMGAGNLTLAKMVLVQAGAAGAIGFGLGVGVAGVTGLVMSDSGSLAFRMTWHVPVFTGVAILICCCVAAVVSLGRVLRLELSQVFRA